MAGGGGFCAFWQRAAGPREQRLLELLSYGLVALGAVSALLLRFIPMPYGRYSSRRFGWLLPARPAWLLQELPALLVPFALAACIPVWRLPNAVLLGCFILHYVHRCGRSGRLSGVLRAIGSRRYGTGRQYGEGFQRSAAQSPGCCGELAVCPALRA